MNQNNSPWIHQLKVTRPVDSLSANGDADVVVVGAGIAGVMTSYFILKNTKHTVVLIEGNKVAHGATGHNAGQIVTDFEKSFTELVRIYGLEKAADAERSVRHAWILLEEIYQEAALATPLSSFMGYNGFRNVNHIADEIMSNVLRKEGGLQTYPIYLTKEVAENPLISKKYKDFYEVVSQEDILSLLETADTSYIGATSNKKGCINSALLSEEIVGYLLTKHPDRFSLFEHSPVAEVKLHKDNAVLDVTVHRQVGVAPKHYSLIAKKVVLCTNGFERIKITNEGGDDIDAKFHHMVNGDIGYMAAYTEEMKEPPNALGYYDQNSENYSTEDIYNTDPYFYVTRRPFEHDGKALNLITIGGPEERIAETQNYDRKGPFAKEKGEEIDAFVHKTFKRSKEKELEYKFKWHGIMCYTPSGLRVVGAEPKNPVLMYNLGCNGVGIMSSIFGASKISKLLAGEKFLSSVFDPKN